MKRTILAGFLLLFVGAEQVWAKESVRCTPADLEKGLSEIVGVDPSLAPTMTARVVQESKCGEGLPIRVLDILAQHSPGLDPSQKDLAVARAMERAENITKKVCSHWLGVGVGLERKKSLEVLFDTCDLGKLDFATREEFVGPVAGLDGWGAVPQRNLRLSGVVVYQALIDIGLERWLARVLGRAISGIAPLSFPDLFRVRNVSDGKAKPPCRKEFCVTHVYPAEGSPMGGETAEIFGRGLPQWFARGRSKVKVAFGSNASPAVSVGSPNRIVAVTPAGRPGTVDVVVSSEDGKNISTIVDGYKYQEAELPHVGSRPDKQKSNQGSKSDNAQVKSTQEEEIPEWLKKKGSDEQGGKGKRHEGEEGKMGKNTSKNEGASDRPHLSLVLSAFNMSGPVASADVRSVLDQNRPALERCVSALDVKTYESKSVGASWIISESGQVENLRVRLVGAANEEVEACISRLVKDWRFKPLRNDYSAEIICGFRIRSTY